jgi:cell division protein FtsW
MMEAKGQYDRILLMTVMLLLAVGVVMVYSSSSAVALTTYNDSSYFMRRQILWAIIGLLFMMTAMRVDHGVLADKRIVLLLLVVTFVLLAAVFVPGIGRNVNGARRWIRAGGFTFQPLNL